MVKIGGTPDPGCNEESDPLTNVFEKSIINVLFLVRVRGRRGDAQEHTPLDFASKKNNT